MAARNTFDLDVRGMLGVQAQLTLMQLPPKLRRRLLTRVSKRVRTMSARRVRAQQTLAGAPFEPRRTPSKRRRRMLSGLIKNKYLDVVKATEDEARLGWKNGLMGFIAAEHQHGRARRYTAAMARKANPINYDADCTEEQAKRLRRLGFKVRQPRQNKRGRSRWVRPSVAWIQANVKYGQAGLLIRELKGEQAGPSSWQIKMPQRDFLGADQNDIAQLIQLVLQQILNAPR